MGCLFLILCLSLMIFLWHGCFVPPQVYRHFDNELAETCSAKHYNVGWASSPRSCALLVLLIILNLSCLVGSTWASLLLGRADDYFKGTFAFSGSCIALWCQEMLIVPITSFAPLFIRSRYKAVKHLEHLQIMYRPSSPMFLVLDAPNWWSPDKCLNASNVSDCWHMEL